jgi:hypothetical protein
VKPSSEALLVSSLVNLHDSTLSTTYGVDPSMLIGFEAELRWVQSFESVYGYAPSADALLSRFPSFPHSDASDAAFAADEVRQAASQRSLRLAVRNASIAIGNGDYTEAAIALDGYVPMALAKPPQNMLWDTTFLADYETRPDALDLPWPTLQEVTGGIRPGDLWYLAARLGQGKSWTALEIVGCALMAGRRVNIFSLEMSADQLMTRLYCILGNVIGIHVDHRAMRDRVFDLVAYRKLLGKIKDEVPGEVFVYDSSAGACTPTMVKGHAGEADLTVIDYVGLMSTQGMRAVDDWRTMASISNELKTIAIAKNTRILSLAQINREGDTISKYPPRVKNLAQSDALGQDGDVILTHKQYARAATIFSVEKNRHGVSGIPFYTRFQPNQGSFPEITEEIADDLRDREPVR